MNNLNVKLSDRCAQRIFVLNI